MSQIRPLQGAYFGLSPTSANAILQWTQFQQERSSQRARAKAATEAMKYQTQQSLADAIGKAVGDVGSARIKGKTQNALMNKKQDFELEQQENYWDLRNYGMKTDDITPEMREQFQTMQMAGMMGRGRGGSGFDRETNSWRNTWFSVMEKGMKNPGKYDIDKSAYTKYVTEEMPASIAAARADYKAGNMTDQELQQKISQIENRRWMYTPTLNLVDPEEAAKRKAKNPLELKYNKQGHAMTLNDKTDQYEPAVTASEYRQYLEDNTELYWQQQGMDEMALKAATLEEKAEARKWARQQTLLDLADMGYYRDPSSIPKKKQEQYGPRPPKGVQKGPAPPPADPTGRERMKTLPESTQRDIVAQEQHGRPSFVQSREGMTDEEKWADDIIKNAKGRGPITSLKTGTGILADKVAMPNWSEQQMKDFDKAMSIKRKASERMFDLRKHPMIARIPANRYNRQALKILKDTGWRGRGPSEYRKGMPMKQGDIVYFTRYPYPHVVIVNDKYPEGDDRRYEFERLELSGAVE